MKLVLAGLFLLGCVGWGRTWAVDSETATALANAAAKLNADGKAEKARALCYKALANDPHCADALLELGRIFEAEGSASVAATFYGEAVTEFGKAETGNAEAVRKLYEAKRHQQALNPFAGRITGIAEDYAQDLNSILKRSSDQITQGEAAQRLAALRLDRYVAADKLPKTTVSAAPPNPPPSIKAPPDADTGPATTSSKKGSSRKTSSYTPSPPPPEPKAATVVPPDVERALRAAGWTTITGNWKQVKAGIYEVTEGRLESTKTNASISVVVQKGGNGSVGIFGRYNEQSNSSYISSYDDTDPYYAKGYGLLFRGAAYSLYTPYNMYYSSRGEYPPYRQRSDPVADGPKHALNVQCSVNNAGTNMQMFLDGKRIWNSNYKITQEGPFVIIIKGTWTIEQPRADGQ